MGDVDVDPLAVLPLTAASARVTFARATDPSRDRAERQEQLRSLTTMLASVRRLVDRCELVVTQLAAEFNSTGWGRACAAGWVVCPDCPGGALSCSAGVGRPPRCGWMVKCVQGRFACGEPTTIVLWDATCSEQAPCLSHVAAIPRHISCIAVVTASGPVRAVLGEVTDQRCVICPPLPSLVQRRSCGG